MKAISKLVGISFLMCLFAAAPAAFAGAATQTVTEKLPISGDVFTCAGADVTVNGVANVVYHVTVNANGGFNIVEAIAGQISGTDEAGNTYSGAVSTSQTLNINAGGEVTAPLTLVLSGSAGQFRLHALQHITVDANGNVTSYVDNFTSDCGE